MFFLIQSNCEWEAVVYGKTEDQLIMTEQARRYLSTYTATSSTSRALILWLSLQLMAILSSWNELYTEGDLSEIHVNEVFSLRETSKGNLKSLSSDKGQAQRFGPCQVRDSISNSAKNFF